jgi:putative aldouronate transport system substrate-binding protein
MRLSLILLVLMVPVLFFAACSKGSRSAQGNSVPVSIEVEVYDRGTDGGKTDAANNAWTDWIKAKVLEDENIAVTFVPIPRSDEGQVLIARMAANSAPDLCFTYAIDNIRNWGIQGGVWDLMPYVEKYLPDLMEFMGEDPSIPGQNQAYHYKDVNTGVLYGIGNKLTFAPATTNTFIRKDWLEKLGLPEPTTTRQYYETLVAFKNNAAKLGVDKVIPLGMGPNVHYQANSLILCAMDPNISPRDKWTQTIDKNYILIPGVKDAIRTLNKWYNEGLIDPDFPLYKDDSTSLNLMKSGIVGSYGSTWDNPYRQNTGVNTYLAEAIPGAKYIPIDPHENAAGTHLKWGTSAAGSTLTSFVPKTSSKVEACLTYINWLCRYENYNFIQFGNEGVNHKVENGIKLPIGTTGPWIQNSGANIDYTPNINGFVVPNKDYGTVLGQSYPGIPPEDIGEAFRISCIDAKVDPYLSVTILSLAPVRQVLADKCSALLINAVTAKPGDFDRVWDTGIEDWLNSGARAVVEEQRAKYK